MYDLLRAAQFCDDLSFTPFDLRRGTPEGHPQIIFALPKAKTDPENGAREDSSEIHHVQGSINFYNVR